MHCSTVTVYFTLLLLIFLLFLSFLDVKHFEYLPVPVKCYINKLWLIDTVQAHWRKHNIFFFLSQLSFQSWKSDSTILLSSSVFAVLFFKCVVFTRRGWFCVICSSHFLFHRKLTMMLSWFFLFLPICICLKKPNKISCFKMHSFEEYMYA